MNVIAVRIKELRILLTQFLVNGGDHRRELIEKSAQAFVLKIIGFVLGYLTIGLITNFFGAKVYGELALSLAVLNIAVLIPKFGLDGALVRIVGELVVKGQSTWPTVKRALLFTGVLAALFAGLLYLLAPLIANGIFNKPGMTANLRVIGIAVIPLTLISIIKGVLRGFKNINASSALPLVSKILMILAVLSLAFWNNVDVVVLQSVAYFAAGIMVLCWFVGKQERGYGRAVDSRRVLSLAFPMMLTSSFALMMNWVDVLMIGSMMQEEDVGIYSVAIRLATITSLGLVSINTIAGPKFVEFYSKRDMVGFENVVRQSTKMIMLVSIPVLLVLLLFPGVILSFFGAGFHLAKPALIWLVLGQFINSCCGSVGNVLQMTGGEQVAMWIIILSTLINVVLNYLLIPIWGIEGGAIGSLVSMSAWNIGMTLAVKYRLGFWVFGFSK